MRTSEASEYAFLRFDPARTHCSLLTNHDERRERRERRETSASADRSVRRFEPRETRTATIGSEHVSE